MPTFLSRSGRCTSRYSLTFVLDVSEGSLISGTHNTEHSHEQSVKPVQPERNMTRTRSRKIDVNCESQQTTT